jgi:hypothetical protein
MRLGGGQPAALPTPGFQEAPAGAPPASQPGTTPGAASGPQASLSGEAFEAVDGVFISPVISTLSLSAPVCAVASALN